MSYISELMECEACGHQFETLLKRSERDDKHECEACKEPKAGRIIALIAINDSDSHTRLISKQPAFVRKLKEVTAMKRAAKELGESGNAKEAARLINQARNINKQSVKE